MAEPFDPDAYLRATAAPAPRASGGGFDPDAYLEATAPAPDRMSKGAARLQGASQTASFGLADEIGGAVAQFFMPERVKLGAAFEASPDDRAEVAAAKDAGLARQDAQPSRYTQARDLVRSADRQAQIDRPDEYFEGQIAGAIPTAFIPGASAATLGRTAATGAVMGGLSGLGGSEEDSLGGMAADTALGAGFGAVLGPAGYGAGKVLQAGGRAVAGSRPVAAVREAIGDRLGRFANTRAVKAAGAIQKDLRGLSDDEIQRRGDIYLREGIVKGGSGAEETLQRATEAMKASGQKIGDVLDSATQDFDLAPVLQRATDEILSPMANNPIAIRDSAKVIDSIKRLAEQAQRGPLSVRDANRIKTALDEGINWKTDPKSVTNAAKRLRSILDDEIETQLGAADPAAREALEAAKGLYGPMKDAVKAGKSAVQRQQGNNFFGLTDYILGGGGMAAGGPAGAALGVGSAFLRKLARERGDSVAAVVAKRLSTAMARPGTAGAAAKVLAREPERLGRYALMLSNALEKGEDEFRALVFAIQQQDPAFKEAVAER